MRRHDYRRDWLRLVSAGRHVAVRLLNAQESICTPLLYTCIRHIRLFHAAASLPHAAGLSGTSGEHLDGIRSELERLILHVVTGTGFEIRIARESIRKEISLTTRHLAKIFAPLRFSGDDPHLLSAGLRWVCLDERLSLITEEMSAKRFLRKVFAFHSEIRK